MKKTVNAITVKSTRTNGTTSERKYSYVNPDVSNATAIKGAKALSSLSQNTVTSFAVTAEYPANYADSQSDTAPVIIIPDMEHPENESLGAFTETEITVAGYNSFYKAAKTADSLPVNMVSYASNSTIGLGIGSDSLVNYGDNNSINTFTGDDTIINYGNNNLLESVSSGSRTVYNYGSNNYIKGKTQNDYIFVGGNNNTIDPAAGLDTIVVVGSDNVVAINKTTAKTIINSNTSTALTVNPTVNTPLNINNYADDMVITGAVQARDTVFNYGKNTYIDMGGSTDSITNFAEYVTIKGGAAQDTIVNYNDHVSINGGASTNVIINSGDDVTIYGGTNAAFISSTSTANTFYVGKSASTICSSGGKDDTIFFDRGELVSANASLRPNRTTTDILFTFPEDATQRICFVGSSGSFSYKSDGEVKVYEWDATK